MSPHASETGRGQQPSDGCRFTQEKQRQRCSRRGRDAPGLTRGVAGLPVGPRAYLLDQGLVVLAVEGHGAVNHGVQQHTQGPGVDLGPPVGPPVDDLWGCVERAAAECLQVLVAVVKVGQAEIGDLGEETQTSTESQITAAAQQVARAREAPG